MENIDWKKAKDFVFRNARPLDLARWKYHFENGSKADVLEALQAFQNEDGGFGNGLELDSLNPNSSPIQTWKAIVRLEEIGIEDYSNEIVQGILKYLSSGKDFNGKQNQWMRVIPSNNIFPHAVWWGFDKANDLYEYNPTACLAGFILKFAKRETQLFAKAETIAKEAILYLKSNELSADSINCFNLMYRLLITSPNKDVIDLAELKNLLEKKIPNCIERDFSSRYVSYVTTPSYLMQKSSDLGVKNSLEYIRKEIEIIPKVQKQDGSFGVTWKWYNDYPDINHPNFCGNQRLLLISFCSIEILKINKY